MQLDATKITVNFGSSPVDFQVSPPQSGYRGQQAAVVITDTFFFFFCHYIWLSQQQSFWLDIGMQRPAAIKVLLSNCYRMRIGPCAVLPSTATQGHQIRRT